MPLSVSVSPRSRDGDRFWFTDGNIVLAVEQKLFKIHRSKLMCSIVFADMLELPQPEVVEAVDGCPLVALPGDSVADWTVVLNWLYDRSSVFESRLATFTIIVGALRISTKYEISDLRSWCKQQLLSRWPSNLSKMNTNAIPNAAEAICLARELDVPEILPAAFYALSVQRWGRGTDGWTSHRILSPEDTRRLVVGREELQEHLINLLTRWESLSRTDHAELCHSCRRACQDWLVARLRPLPSSPYTHWLLRDLHCMSQSAYTGLSVCHPCRATFGQVIHDFTQTLQEAIPRYFML
ncbi:hypothetical protein ID866_2353 [Astraeus odoratus]|nr:hypothetical protein ID866_2353 [Astraeus odoratus]